MPDTKPSIHAALNAVKTAVGAVAKTDKNSVQNFNFRGIDAVVNAVAPELNKHGVITTPEVLEHVYDIVEIGKNKTLMSHVTVAVKYTFHGPAGDSISCTVLAEAMDSGDKACAKAMSVAYRIALLQTLNLPTDEPDPDSQSYERSSQDAPAARTRKPRPEAGEVSDSAWKTRITVAATVEELREVWKDAGAAGALQNKVEVADGVFTIQELLFRRNDELSLPKSA